MPGEWSTPVIGKGLVYLSPEDGGLSAHSIGSGNKQWGSPEASAAPSGPLLDGAILYTIGGVSGTSVILALDGQTGRKLWAVPAISDASESTDVPFTMAAGTVYTATGAVIRALDARDGTEAMALARTCRRPYAVAKPAGCPGHRLWRLQRL